MSKQYNRALAFIVLISFLALLTPKSIWHDCSHEKHAVGEQASKTTKRSFQQGYEKCQVCDLHIPLSSAPLAAFRITFHHISDVRIPAEVLQPDFSDINSLPLRGPPVSMTA